MSAGATRAVRRQLWIFTASLKRDFSKRSTRLNRVQVPPSPSWRADGFFTARLERLPGTRPASLPSSLDSLRHLRQKKRKHKNTRAAYLLATKVLAGWVRSNLNRLPAPGRPSLLRTTCECHHRQWVCVPGTSGGREYVIMGGWCTLSIGTISVVRDTYRR